MGKRDFKHSEILAALQHTVYRDHPVVVNKILLHTYACTHTVCTYPQPTHIRGLVEKNLFTFSSNPSNGL
jgi:hypothetical protein